MVFGNMILDWNYSFIQFHGEVFSYSVVINHFSCIHLQMSFEARKVGGIVDVAVDDILVMDSYCE